MWKQLFVFQRQDINTKWQSIFTVFSAELQKDIANRKLLAPLVLVGDATAHNHSLEDLQKKQNFSVWFWFGPMYRLLTFNVSVFWIAEIAAEKRPPTHFRALEG